MSQLYVTQLWDPATPSYVSADKGYFGEAADLRRLAAANGHEGVAGAIDRFLGGDKDASASIFHWPSGKVLQECLVAGRTEIKVPRLEQEHRNAWGCTYFMRADEATIRLAWVGYRHHEGFIRFRNRAEPEVWNMAPLRGKTYAPGETRTTHRDAARYSRIASAEFASLRYSTGKGGAGGWHDAAAAWTWGQRGFFVRDGGILRTAVAVEQARFGSRAGMLEDMRDPSHPLRLGAVFDEIFGDG